MSSGIRTPRTREIVQLALLGKTKQQIIQQVRDVPPTTIYEIIRKYTREVRILIRALPDEQEELRL